MKILHVIHSIDPRSGGPSHALREMVKTQIERGHELTILTTTTQSAEPWLDAGQYQRQMGADAVLSQTNLVIATAFGRHRPWSRFAYSPDARRWLRRNLSKSSLRPDVVHVHGIFSHLTAVAARLARQYDVPYILRPAGSLDQRCAGMGRKHLKTLFSFLFLKNDLKGAACIHATSSAEASELKRFVPAERICTVPHGASELSHSEAETSDWNCAIKTTHPEIASQSYVLYMSRIVDIKRPELVVAAFAKLVLKFPHLQLVMAGSDAGQLAATKALVEALDLQDRVHFLGFLQGDLKNAVFSHARVFVLPSLHENFGVAVIEAMSHGIPVVVTRGVASHQYVDESQCGLTVDGNADAIAAAIAQILNSDGASMGNRGKDYVQRNLAWPEIGRQIDEMYFASTT